MMDLPLTSWKESHVFREVLEEGRAEGRQEGKLEAVPAMVAQGFSAKEIADILSLSVEQVQTVQL